MEVVCDKNYKPSIYSFSELKYDSDIHKEKGYSILDLEYNEDLNFIVFIGIKDKIEPCKFFLCKYSKDKNSIIPDIIKYGKTTNLNPLKSNIKEANYYFYMIQNEEIISLNNIIKNKLNKLMNISIFKIKFKKFLNEYLKLFNKYNFLYNNLSALNIYYNDEKFILTDFIYATDETKKSKIKKNEFKIKQLFSFDIEENKIINKVNNIELKSLLYIINICDRHLNDIPKGIYLNDSELEILNSDKTFYDKLKLIINHPYFNIL